MYALLSTLFTLYLWFVGVFIALIVILLAFAALIWVGGMIVLGTSKLCLLWKAACAKVIPESWHKVSSIS